MGFLVSHNTWDTARVLRDFAYKAITFFGPAFQPVQLSVHIPTLQSRNPPHLFSIQNYLTSITLKRLNK
jgi:hypothetical protein